MPEADAILDQSRTDQRTDPSALGLKACRCGNGLRRASSSSFVGSSLLQNQLSNAFTFHYQLSCVKTAQGGRVLEASKSPPRSAREMRLSATANSLAAR